MSDHDQTLAGGSLDPTPRPAVPGLAESAVDAILTLDEIMNSARLVERTARICLRGDLEAELVEAMEELAQLVDDDGTVIAEGDQALSDGHRAQELAERIQQIRGEMRAATRRVRFRAMPDDEWDVFDKARQDALKAGKGQEFDYTDYNNRIVARCAIAPTMTVDQVKAMRGKLTPTQFSELANTAWAACTTGGLDVPKSPSYLPAPKPQASGRSSD